MSKQTIKMVVKLNIKQDSIQLFKRLVTELKDVVEVNESSTIEYEWFIDEVQQTCYIVESYADSNALLTHLGNSQEKLGLILDIAPIEQILVFGELNHQVAEFLAGLNAKVFSLHAGFSR